MGNKPSSSMFDHYARNLEIISPYINSAEKEYLKDAYLCPICFKIVPRLNIDHLRREHVPSGAVGGRVRTLTCEDCNHNAGTKLESDLLMEQQFKEWEMGVPGSFVPGRYTVAGSRQLNAHMAWSEDGAWVLDGHPTKEDAVYITDRMKKWPSFENLTWNFATMPFSRRRSRIARLRFAYLLAFSAFGYGFVFSPNLEIIRRQIRHPEEEMLQGWELSSKLLSDLSEGFHVITAPKDLQAFLVVFDLVAPKGTRSRYGVVLPGPGELGLGIYDWLKERKGVPIQVKGAEIRPPGDFNDDPFAVYRVWAEVSREASAGR